MGILGYANDNMLLSPTLDGLQRIINICELYAKEYNLTFSTNDNANKWKTKCMALLKKGRNLKALILCGLPMVNSIRHLGNKIRGRTCERRVPGIMPGIIIRRPNHIM